MIFQIKNKDMIVCHLSYDSNSEDSRNLEFFHLARSSDAFRFETNNALKSNGKSKKSEWIRER
jgi:hypothetical protein